MDLPGSNAPSWVAVKSPIFVYEASPHRGTNDCFTQLSFIFWHHNHEYIQCPKGKQRTAPSATKLKIIDDSQRNSVPFDLQNKVQHFPIQSH